MGESASEKNARIDGRAGGRRRRLSRRRDGVPKTHTYRQVQAEEGAFVRHNLPTVGGKFAVGAAVDGKLVGVAIAGRPVARRLDDGKTLEVLRVCTDGTPSANSFLYSR